MLVDTKHKGKHISVMPDTQQPKIEMPAPKKRARWPSVEDMKPGDWKDTVETGAKSMAEAMRYRGWVAVRKTIKPGVVRVWRYS